MPETELHDLAEKPAETKAIAPEGKEPKPYYHTLPLSEKNIPEIEDFGLGDDIILEIHCHVTDEHESEDKDKPRSITLEMRKGRVLNLKESRQKAIRMGISKKSLKEIKGGEEE